MVTDENTNLAEDFITGIETRLDINNSDSHNGKLHSVAFLAFMDEVQNELNTSVAVFIEVNGHNVNQLIKKHTDINILFANNTHYSEFLALFKRTKANIEQLVAADNNEQAAQQAIIDETLKLRAFIEARYPSKPSAPSAPQEKRKMEFFLGMGIVFFPIIFAWFTLRKGYSNIIRLVSFLWLVVFLVATFPTAKDEIKETENSSKSSQPISITEK